jgi:toxin HigB-1
MIGSFKDQRTKRIFDGTKVARLDKPIYDRTRRKLQQLEAATRIEDLYFPPSNKFHALQGHNPTRYAIWINEQWRISFEWSGDRADNVLFEDYH